MNNIKIWNNDIPFNTDKLNFVPSIDEYIIQNAKSCIIVIPGGGYEWRADQHEGKAIAEELNKNNISAFVLNYRVTPYKYPAMLYDVKRAVRVVRSMAKKFGYDENKIGVMGFSAGGHLASMAVTQFDEGIESEDLTDRISSRPNLGILCYPVITLGKYTHQGSHDNLLGQNPDKNLEFTLSSENSIKDNTPPCFIWHTAEDDCVPMQNSLLFSEKLREKGIPHELHIFPYGRHGMGLATEENPHVAQWFSLCVNFIRLQFGL